MEEAARRYARKILLLHLLALVAIVCGVAVAARGVHGRARGQVIGQAKDKQMLLAGQTARGIENHYASIFQNLDLIRRGDQDGDGKPDPEREERREGRGGGGGGVGRGGGAGGAGPGGRVARMAMILGPMLC